MRANPIVLTLTLVAACGAGGGAGPDASGGGDDDPSPDADPNVVEPGDPGPSDVQLDVRTDQQRRPISRLIYGFNGDGGATLAENRPTVVRSGGNRLSAYNWENNASNAGKDYCHQNDGSLGGPGSPPGNAYLDLLDDARARGTAAIITVPILDHVAADHDDLGDGGQGPPACVGDVANSGGNFLDTRFVDNVARKGAAFSTTPNLTDGTVYQDEAVAFVRAGWGDVEVLVSLDNEPDLWSDTHARVHPAPVGYDELVERTERFGTAVKDAWPEAGVLGFVSYGYAGYMNLQNAPDRGNNGDFIPYFLDQMQDAEGRAGHRVVDYLDLHWYSEARGGGVRVADTGDGTGAAERVQSTRSLWDPTYREDSWIVNDVLDAPIRLIPWLHEQIDGHYPGTRLAFTEWNYGGGGHISGAIATADALGIFGREGVAVATLWFLHGNETFTRAGLRAFTSYDGAGAGFGDTSILATTSDVARVTVYASDGSNQQVIIAINKATAPVTAGVRIATPRTVTRARRYVLDGDAPTIAAESAIDATATNAFLIPLPASSITIIIPE